MNPAVQARYDFFIEGCNANPYPENSGDWETYEQTYDLLCMEEEQRSARERYDAACEEARDKARGHIDGH